MKQRALKTGRKVYAMVGMVGALSMGGGSLAKAELSTNSVTGTYEPYAATAPGRGFSEGILNDWLRSQSTAFEAWDLGGQVRLRLEVKDHFATPGAAPNLPGHTPVDFLARPARRCDHPRRC